MRNSLPVNESLLNNVFNMKLKVKRIKRNMVGA